MAEADFAALTGSALGSSDVRKGVSAAFSKPTGGGSMVCGFRALTTTTGMAGWSADLAGFNPITGTKKGGSIRAAMKRYTASLGYMPILGLFKGTDPATMLGYFLCLTNAASYKIALKKGSVASGMNASDSNVVRVSTETFSDAGNAVAAWRHLRLDVLVNPHGDVVLSVFKNLGDVTAPSWVTVSGMDVFIDDSLGVLLGAAGITPYLDGFYGAFGHYTESAQGSVSLFDQFELHRQESP